MLYNSGQEERKALNTKDQIENQKMKTFYTALSYVATAALLIPAAGCALSIFA